MRISSWNINGLRAAVRKGFTTWLDATRPDIVSVQEIRAHPHQLEAEVSKLKPRHVELTPARRLGYSGLGLFAHRRPSEVYTSLGVRRFDVEGRFQLARFGRLWVCNVYVPSGNGVDRDLSRTPYKLAFLRTLKARLESLRAAKERVLVMGDFNIAHEEIDLARPRENRDNSGFLPKERAALRSWFDAGWVDTFREVHGPVPGHYSWWSTRSGVRERNIGWRIDLVLATPQAMRLVRDAYIERHIYGSDHCPVGVRLRA
ncbi:MAG: exodeoxyribonuclease III [Myxococcaceae bacterium]|nr:exodeoxyribonuclease III [Myxococcaceae bacterium]